MNIIQKIYCRLYQGVFKLAIPILPYRKPEIFNSVESIPSYLKTKNLTRVLLVTDEYLLSSGLTAPLIEALLKNGIKCSVFSGVKPNPTVKNVEDALALFKAESCEALIGFGGGSAIDCAKAVGARAARPKKPVSKMKGVLHIRKRIPTLIAIPTTAGTGSEVTLATVITDHGSGHKFPINDFCLIPRAAVLDPKLTVTLPPSLTATTGMDALTHAVEAYIGGSTTKETREAALLAVKLISENLERAYRNGADLEARSSMLRAAYLAGVAFTKSYVGYCHSVAHSLGGRYNTPHGLANAVILPYTLESYGKRAWKRTKPLAIAAHVAKESDSPETAYLAFIAWIREMNARMNIPEKFDFIKSEDIPSLAKKAAKEGNPLYPVPKLMNASELESIYERISAK